MYRIAAVLLVLVVTVVVFATSSTHAAFPGRNGAVAYGWLDFHATWDEQHGVEAEYIERSIRLILPSGERRLLYGCAGIAVLACDTQRYSDPTFAPNGRRVAFDTGNALASIDVDGSNFHLLESHGGDDGEPAFSPAGTQIAFTNRVARGTSLWVCAADGSDARQIARNGVSPTWSTRNWIAFVRGRWIWRMRPDGSRLRRLGRGTAPAWSPDGTRIAFTRDHAYPTDIFGDTSGLLIMNADGSGAHALPKRGVGSNVLDLAWSPDARRLLALPYDLVAVSLNGRLRKNYGEGESSGAEYRTQTFGIDWQPLPR